MKPPIRSPADREAVTQRILATVDSVPPGRVASYGQIAAEAGLPGRARQVGHALRTAPEAGSLPWHRVLNSRGGSSFPPGSRGRAEQLRRLRAEGVEVGPRGVVDLERFGWRTGSPQQ